MISTVQTFTTDCGSNRFVDATAELGRNGEDPSTAQYFLIFMIVILHFHDAFYPLS